MKQFSFIIPTYNRPELLNELLQSIVNQDFEKDNFEFLVIDNNSENDVKSLIQDYNEQYPDVAIKYLNEKKQGEQYAWNRGVAESKGKLLIFVDDDAVLHHDYLKTLQRDFADNLDNIAGGGKIAAVFEYQKPPWINKYVMPYFAEINLGEKSKFPKNKSPFATNMLVSKNLFDEIGPFNTNLKDEGKPVPPGTFEKDLFSRIRKQGITIYYYHDLMVWHFIPSEKISKQYIKDRVIEAGLTQGTIYKQKSTGWYFYAFWVDFLKWVASVVLAFYYIFTTQWEKAGMLFKLRWWRSKGLWRTLLG